MEGDHHAMLTFALPMEQTTTPFSVLLSRIQAGQGASMLDVPDDWLQGRTLFGGLQAVLGPAAVRSPAPGAPPRLLPGTLPPPRPRRVLEGPPPLPPRRQSAPPRQTPLR